VFGLEEGQRYEQLRQTMSRMLDGFGSPLGAMFLFYPFLQKEWRWSPWGKFLQRRQQVDALLYAEIRDRYHQPDSGRTDILALLMAARGPEGTR
jgi:cytochrome P450